MGHELGLKVIAEGIETEKHIAELVALNCEMGQGYFYAKPMDQAGMAKLIPKFL